ncbi:MAG: hypothetical protein QOF84_5293, partial [Streptomyces sp.]|nr:hypothetical protein [Streptomyces sp.]
MTLITRRSVLVAGAATGATMLWSPVTTAGATTVK